MESIDVVKCGTDDFCNIDLPGFAKERHLQYSFLAIDSFLQSASPLSDSLVVLIDDFSLRNKGLINKLIQKISNSEYQSRLCLWKNVHLKSASQFIPLFDDFIFLPCRTEELQIRLNRLYKPKPEFSNIELLKEFAPLKLRGESPVFTKVLQIIKQSARFDVSVLIEGETGTGKENAARAIHYLGPRESKPFIPVNCGAIPDNLVESELFGFERGAFTDAKQKTEGLLALANGGTLFLDEVDSLSPKAQATLLRFLQTGEYRPLGSKQICHSNVRVIAATNRVLEEQVRLGAFREDLFFRLNVFQLRMPALRDRRQDIPVLAKHLLHKYCREHGMPAKQFHVSSLDWLMQQKWPGNIRELENTILRELLLHDDSQFVLMSEHENSKKNKGLEKGVEAQSSNISRFQTAKDDAITRFEKDYISNLLSITAGNVSEAARIAGKERRSLGKLLKKYNIDKRHYSEQEAGLSVI